MTALFRRAFGASVVLAATLGLSSAQPERSAQAAPVYGGETPVTINGVQFRLTSVILTEEMGNLTMQVAMTVTDLESTPVSTFIVERSSSVMTDTGLVFNATIMNAAGVGACQTIRDDCVRGADQYLADIYPNAPDYMTFSVRSNSSSLNLSHEVLGGASTANVSLTFYVRKANGTGSFIPVTFGNVRIRNMTH